MVLVKHQKSILQRLTASFKLLFHNFSRSATIFLLYERLKLVVFMQADEHCGANG